MCSFRFTIPSHFRQDVEKKLKVAQALGDQSQINRWMVILAVINRQPLNSVDGHWGVRTSVQVLKSILA